MQIGIDAIQFYIPKLVLPIERLAEARNIDPAKLKNGLGLKAMRLMDVNEDVVSMATTAVFRLLQQTGLSLADVDRLYVGTESGIDNSKPVASYVLQNLVANPDENKTMRCDAVDFTFACIGAVDALHNCLDFVRLNPTKKAIVVATDFAKYELESTGEYTQGAGAFALLLSCNPRLLAFESEFGVSTKGVFDFFKPKYYFDLPTASVGKSIPVIKDEPVFDGQYSNACYINQISDAYEHFKEVKPSHENSKQWDLICMHLPYCFQGRRTFIELYAKENKALFATAEGNNHFEQIKTLSKSKAYIEFVEKTIAPSELLSAQVGNCYTGSIFLGLISSLLWSIEQNTTPKKIGFIAYGSGSKSKVFEAALVPGWQKHFDTQNVLNAFDDLVALDFETYEQLHKNELKKPIAPSSDVFKLERIEADNPVLFGARFYHKPEIN